MEHQLDAGPAFSLAALAGLTSRGHPGLDSRAEVPPPKDGGRGASPGALFPNPRRAHGCSLPFAAALSMEDREKKLGTEGPNQSPPTLPCGLSSADLAHSTACGHSPAHLAAPPLAGGQIPRPGKVRRGGAVPWPSTAPRHPSRLHTK